MKRIGFILKQGKESARQLALELAPALRTLGAEVVMLREDDVEGERIVSEPEFASAIDLAVVLGGDGTMLRASRVIGNSGTPVLGINQGRLGFLAPFEPSVALETIRDALAGKLPETRRMRIQVRLESRTGETQTLIALNDVVIHQGAVARLLELNAYLDDDFIASYRADGLIVATPTGSTAYNLAAGGPILLPEQQAMALTPICAHALTMRPLVASHDSTVTIATDDQEAAVTVDGYWSQTLYGGDRLVVTEASAPLIVFGAPGKGYFDILREKMHWGVRERSASSD